MVNKVCSKCNTGKCISEFYRNKNMKDGHVNECKSCAKIRIADWNNKNRDKVRSYNRKWASENRELCNANTTKYRENNRSKRADFAKKYRAENKDKIRDYKIKYKSDNPKKHNSHVRVSLAIKSGDLIKPLSCECCGVFTEALHAHHCDYNKPLDVNWLCHICHADWHKNNTPIV